MLAASLLLVTWLTLEAVLPAAAPRTATAVCPRGAAARQYCPEEPHRTVALRWENDVVGGTDQNYSNGISLTISRDGSGLLGGIWRWFGAPGERRISSYEIGQLIVTPADITRPVPDPADRPYAGLLYVALSTEVVSGNHFQGLKLVTGVVGPAALAAEAQKAFHRLIGSPAPKGWDHQLKNEPILNVVYEYRRRYTLIDSSRDWSADLVPMAGGMLGNVLIQAQTEGQMRFGYHVPDDFGTTTMRGLGSLPFPLSRDQNGRHAGNRPARFGVYAFAGGGGSLVARNLTLDGNTFRDGPRVPKKTLVPGAELGVSVWTSRFGLTVSYVFWGREYETQTQGSQFGAATIALRF